jgi:hypothetical protein
MAVSPVKRFLARVMHETSSRNRGDDGATGQPQGLGLGAFKTRGAPDSG